LLATDLAFTAFSNTTHTSRKVIIISLTKALPTEYLGLSPFDPRPPVKSPPPGPDVPANNKAAPATDPNICAIKFVTPSIHEISPEM
jgi:hypothetical protein